MALNGGLTEALGRAGHRGHCVATVATVATVTDGGRGRPEGSSVGSAVRCWHGARRRWGGRRRRLVHWVVDGRSKAAVYIYICKCTVAGGLPRWLWPTAACKGLEAGAGWRPSEWCSTSSAQRQCGPAAAAAPVCRRPPRTPVAAFASCAIRATMQSLLPRSDPAAGETQRVLSGENVVGVVVVSRLCCVDCALPLPKAQQSAPPPRWPFARLLAATLHARKASVASHFAERCCSALWTRRHSPARADWVASGREDLHRPAIGGYACALL